MKSRVSSSRTILIASTIVLLTTCCSFITLVSGTLTVQSDHKISKRSPQVLSFEDVDPHPRDFLVEDQDEIESIRRKRDVNSDSQSQSTSKSKTIPQPNVVSKLISMGY